MDIASIVKVLNERKQIVHDMKQEAKKLSNLNALVNSLSSSYPELFDEAIKVCGDDNDSVLMKECKIKPQGKIEWDSRLSFRQRVMELLMESGRCTKVSELAKMAFAKEPFYTTETEATLQSKISRTLTALKKIKKLGIENRKVHSGSSGIAWGLKEWENEEEQKLKTKYMRGDENGDRTDNHEFFE